MDADFRVQCLYLLWLQLNYVLQTETPPSASKAVPVVKLDASDARYNADFAISSGEAKRFNACMLFTNSIASGVFDDSRPIGVSVPPGNKALTLIPSDPYSDANAFVKPIIPALLAE